LLNLKRNFYVNKMDSPAGMKENDESLQIKLLELIEEGDPTVILSSEYIESLNELIKHEFISIENDKLKLTEKGVQAKTVGVKSLMHYNVPANEELSNDPTRTKTASVLSNRSFLIILFFMIVSLAAMLTAMSFY
jgi:hypothetical protein